MYLVANYRQNKVLNLKYCECNYFYNLLIYEVGLQMPSVVKDEKKTEILIFPCELREKHGNSEKAKFRRC